MTSAPPQYSPDGRWWWDGQQWLPAQPSPGYGPSGQQGYGYQPYAQQQPTDGKAIASLVTGLIWVWGLGSIAAVILGHLSRREAKRENRPPSGLALAGLILGYVGIAGAALFLGVFFAFGTGLEVDSVGGTSTTVLTASDTRSQLSRLGMAEEAFFAANNDYTQDESALSAYGWDGGDVLIASADDTSYCLQGVDGSTALYLSNDGRGVSETPCT